MAKALQNGNDSSNKPVATMQTILSAEDMVNQMARNLQYLRRSDLITVDWSKRTIKREKSLSEYVKKTIISGPMWPNISEDWRKINNVLLNKHGTVNAEYQQLLPKQ